MDDQEFEATPAPHGTQAQAQTSASASASTSAPPPPVHGRKKGTACLRCRTQKIRCDDQQPACGNCARVGHTCIRPGLVPNPTTLSHLSQVEGRLRWLEDALREVAPEKMDQAPVVTAKPEDEAPAPIHNQAAPPEPLHILPTTVQAQQPQQPVQRVNSGQTPLSVDNVLNVFESTPDSQSDLSQTDASPATSTQIKPSEPLAHEVGLLSLANCKESKYLGPSSGVPFARLIFSAIPQSQGLATSWATPSNTSAQHIEAQKAIPFPPNWISDVDLQHFVDAYFETYQPLYPFLDEDHTHSCLQSLFTKHHQYPHQMPQLSEIEAILSPVYSVQIFLIIALGSRTLEARLSTDFSSERYFATAMSRLDSLALHDSIEGLQIMLLLILCGFNFVHGPNAWFLTSNVIASCLDLGFQRRWIDTTATMTEQEQRLNEMRTTLRSGIFWSAYSLERQLAVVLGRPLTLRDEAIDVEFPGGAASVATGNETTHLAAQSPKRTKVQIPAFLSSHYSFRFDRILAEIKLTLYRVVNLPDRFPWPTDTPQWQTAVHKSCDELYRELTEKMKWQSRRTVSDHGNRSLEIKYHQCLMLLYRPSPAISHPTLESWRICYNSAVKTVLISAELQRFCKLSNSWLTAHNVFVSGITFLYCLWINPGLLQEVGIDAFKSNSNACASVLRYLGKTWNVAADALEKFERLVQITTTAWLNRTQEHRTEVEAGQSLISMHQSQWQGAVEGDAGNNSAEGTGLFPSTDFPSVYNNVDFSSFYTELGDLSTWFDLDWITQVQEFGDYRNLDTM
ncbi:hypothetical protein NW762_013734 [Fusarium torreyae]|uniref:Zn(2)-C6 fungal-type domain-containing protein n=1 Tax=Fusarium torreyae TaxID=1237075 RepID=A0A9W8RLA5_9HYPO|nr:hypothetical protein NW762_013734 [Fusarium torreyae]